MTWQLTNNSASPIEITGDTAGVPFDRNDVPAFGSRTARRVIDGPVTDDQLINTVSVDLGGGLRSELSDRITAAACPGPPFPPDVTFTFTKTSSVSRAAVGETVEYTYCGQNTSAIELEVVRLVDDRLGVVVELPSVATVVAPGESICTTDLGVGVSYVVQARDAGSVIHNNAVVTVRTHQSTPREFQATATSDVAVPLLRRAQDNVCDSLSTGHLVVSPAAAAYAYTAPAGFLVGPSHTTSPAAGRVGRRNCWRASHAPKSKEPLWNAALVGEFRYFGTSGCRVRLRATNPAGRPEMMSRTGSTIRSRKASYA